MEKFITLVIHTHERAVSLRKILESHGIEVRFENLVISGSPIASGVRVKINEKNLPLALKIIESGDPYSAAKVEMKITGQCGNLLIPVDFSSHGLTACKVAFQIAKKMSLHPVLLNAYTTPYYMGNLAYDNSVDPTIVGDGVSEIEQLSEERDLRAESEKMMRDFRNKLDEAIDAGDIDKVKYSSVINEGVPEDVILEYCRLTPPALVVMATRGNDKKKNDLIGSVTAEVVDSCRVPVLTIPENFEADSRELMSNVIYFCNVDQHDILSVDTIMRTFEFPDVNMTLVPVNERAGGHIDEKVDALRDYFTKNYPAAHFSSHIFEPSSFREDLDTFITGHNIELIIVPNKKRNIFSRLFRPGIAHKILFERDIPMLSLPI